MALPHGTKVFAVKDCRISKVTTDSAGGATVYAASVDVPAIRKVTVTETWKEAYLRGDNTLLDYESARDTVKVVVEHGKLSADVLATLVGATVADTGVTPNQKVTITYAPADTPAYFKLEAQAVSVDGIGGDYHLILGKCKVGGNRPFGVNEEDFEDFQFEAVALPPLGTGSVWYSETIQETASVIS